MSLTHRFVRRPLVALALIPLAFALVACGGTEEATPAPTPEPAREITAEAAPAVAAAGLLTLADLPEGAWEVNEGSDNPAEAGVDGGFFGDSPACDQFAAAFEGLTTGTDTSPLADATRSFSTGAIESLVVQEVTSAVAVMPADFDSAARVAELKALVTPEALQPCLDEAFAAAFGTEGVTINQVAVTTPTTLANADAGGVAIDMDAVMFILPIKLHLEIHFWSQGQVAGSLLIAEMNADLLATNMPAIVQAAASRLATAESQ
ncbi:MAG: hypothetical protein DWG83_01485 [Chloroflexi bacterium]|nr:hypothetical protein [Chloroflexota bacterium]MDA1239614.1 hypothetical protein [Chloroflexota bacterium]MQC19228.1 hypothetical protein [Chloroflexota bacterium]